MGKWFIDYGTAREIRGMGNELVEGTLEEAMAKADAKICYTQRDVTIAAVDGSGFYIRRWWGYLDGIENCEHPIQYGDYGFYGDWE